MGHDLLIRDAMILDGTGAPGRRGDVAVDAGRIASVGERGADATVVIDAEGRAVAPGFIDVHTHYDAQVTWDPLCFPTPCHGVTTVVTGNCGYALAPVRARDRDSVMGLFSRVEQISKQTLEAGVPWEWETQAEYAAWLERRGLGVNVAAQVGHSAVRRHVLGDAASERAASAEEIETMAALVRDGMAAGAVGFTTSRVAHQRGEHGEPIPSFVAEEEELFALAEVLGELGRGMIGINPRTKAQDFCEADRVQLCELARRSGRPVTWNEFGQRDEWPDQWRSLLDFMEGAQREGQRIAAVMRCQRMDLHFSLRDTHAFDGAPGWKETLALPKEAKLARLGDPARRRALAQELASGFEGARPWFRRIGVARCRQPAWEGRLLSELAAERGEDEGELFLALAAGEALETEFAFFGLSNCDEKAVAEMLRSPATLAGISDAGAHLHTFTGVDYPTHLLGHWVRERGVLGLEAAVRELTSVPAAWWGLSDRGVLRPGAAADLVIFDPETVGPGRLEIWEDLPGRERRHAKRARGALRHVLVNGRVLLRDGEPSGDLPGAVLPAATSAAR